MPIIANNEEWSRLRENNRSCHDDYVNLFCHNCWDFIYGKTKLTSTSLLFLPRIRRCLSVESSLLELLLSLLQHAARNVLNLPDDLFEILTFGVSKGLVCSLAQSESSPALSSCVWSGSSVSVWLPPNGKLSSSTNSRSWEKKMKEKFWNYNQENFKANHNLKLTVVRSRHCSRWWCWSSKRSSELDATNCAASSIWWDVLARAAERFVGPFPVVWLSAETDNAAAAAAKRASVSFFFVRNAAPDVAFATRIRAIRAFC